MGSEITKIVGIVALSHDSASSQNLPKPAKTNRKMPSGVRHDGDVDQNR
jgi:hypothetical protein